MAHLISTYSCLDTLLPGFLITSAPCTFPMHVEQSYNHAGKPHGTSRLLFDIFRCYSVARHCCGLKNACLHVVAQNV